MTFCKKLCIEKFSLEEPYFFIFSTTTNNANMTDFYGKTASLIPEVSISPSDTGAAHPVTAISMLSGATLTVPSYQVPAKNPYRLVNMWRYQASGQYDQILSTGGQVQVPIIRGSGSGHVEKTWLRIQVKNNTGASIQMQPVPLWLQSLVFQTPSGATIQTGQGTALYGNIASVYQMEEWYEVSKACGMNLEYESGDPIEAGDTMTYYIPLIGNFLDAGSFFLPATTGDIQCYLNFWPDNNIRNTGTGPLTVVQISLDVKMELLAPQVLDRTRALFKGQRFDYLIPYFKWQNFTQQLALGQTAQLNLSSIKGDVGIFDFVIRPSYVKDDLTNFQIIDSYQIQNQEGVGISGQQFIDDMFSRKILYPSQNDGTLSRHRRWYRHVFANNDYAVKNLLQYALKLGAYPFDNHNTLNIITPALGGVNEKWALVTSVFGTAPYGGNAMFTWQTPDGLSSSSIEVPYTDLDTAGSPLAKAAIEGMTNFTGTVTITGRISLNTLLIEFTGNYGHRALADEGYVLQCNSGLFCTVPTIVGAPGNQMGIPLYAVMTVNGRNGITNGASYLVDVYVTTTGYVSLLPDGSMKAYNS